MQTLGGALLATVALAPLMAPASAGAQEVGPFDPLGIRQGVFLIYPQVDAGLTYDSNIFADDDAEEDIILSVAPSVTAQSQWSRHELEANFGAEGAAYVDNEDANYLDIGGGVAGRYDIGRANFARGSIDVERGHEDFDSPDEVNADESTTIFGYRLALDYRQTFNRFFVQPGVRLQRTDFDESEANFRDRTRYIATLRGGFALSPRLRLVAVADYDVVTYDENRAFDRDNVGYALRAGVEADLTNILTGELTAGFVRREYDDDALDDVNGPSVAGALTYNLSPLTSFVATLSAAAEETIIAFEGDTASSQFRTSAILQAFHELRRNIRLNAEAGYVRDDFTGTDRVDDTFAAGLGAEYFLSRNLSIDAAYRFTTRQSDLGDAEYDRNVIFVGVTARL